MSDLNTHGYKMTVGKHSGELITRVPVGYLRWMVNINHSEAEYARAELARRGTVVPEIEISGHAIDRASLNCIDLWGERSNQDEGLHAWLVRVAQDALKKKPFKPDRFWRDGIVFVFDMGMCCPTLKTVFRKSKEPNASDGNEDGGND